MRFAKPSRPFDCFWPATGQDQRLNRKGLTFFSELPLSVALFVLLDGCEGLIAVPAGDGRTSPLDESALPSQIAIGMEGNGGNPTRDASGGGRRVRGCG